MNRSITNAPHAAPDADPSSGTLALRVPPGPADYPFLHPPSAPGEIGRLGNYRVLRLLGRGGMGYVFHAEDLTLCRPVALKVMNPELGCDVQGWQRFLREAQLMASVKHDALVTVFQAGREGQAVYLAMELLAGQSLDDWLTRVRHPELPDLLRIAREIVTGLSVIHGHGLMHRDLKPGNVWLEAPARRVKILDFGLARFVNDNASLTQTGMVLGTPAFMSPEQARGEPLDARSDLFSFGCILYCLCTGKSPFRAETTTATLLALALNDPRPVQELNPAIPTALSDLVTDLLAKNPDDRPPSAEVVHDRLLALEGGKVALSTMCEPVPLPARQAAPARRPKKTTGTNRRPKKASVRDRRWLKVGLALVLAAGAAFLAPRLYPAVFWPQVVAEKTPPEKSAVGEVTYLSEWEPTARVYWPFLPPAHPGKPRMQAIGVLRRGVFDPHGIFMHPPPGHEGAASLSYRLGKQYRTFHAEVSLHDGPASANTPCLFAVYGDGRLLWKSQLVSSQADAQTCAVSVQGVERLRIEVSCSGDPRGAHTIWGEPRVTK